jgi:cysteine desulfurase/selenocysteine lyase
MKDLRADFPLLQKNPELVYLDSACTSLKPAQVIEAEKSYYEDLGACGGRSSHRLGRETSEALERARENVAGFVGAKAGELVWTRNTTEALNIVVKGLEYGKKRKIVTTVMEHHAVLLPLMKMQERGIVELAILECDRQGIVGIEKWENAIDGNTALVITNSWNNTTGRGQNVEEISKIAHDAGTLVCIDGAQGVPHHKTEKNTDFLCFSGHKMLGPTGIGALVAKKGAMEKIEPLLQGGGTVKTVAIQRIEPMKDNTRFEAGVQHYGGMIGFSAAIDYLKGIGIDAIESKESALAAEMLKVLQDCGAIVYGQASVEDHGALYSFNFKNANPHDVALLLDKEDIAVRSGFFCAQPAMEAVGAKDGAVRASAYVYNNPDDIKKFGEAMQKISVLYG